jgi:hypothetical protein
MSIRKELMDQSFGIQFTHQKIPPGVSASIERASSYRLICCPACAVGVQSLAHHIPDHELMSQEGRDAVRKATLEIERLLGFKSSEESNIPATCDKEIEGAAGTGHDDNDTSPDLSHNSTTETQEPKTFAGWPCSYAVILRCNHVFKDIVQIRLHERDAHEDIVDGKVCMVPNCIRGIQQLPLHPCAMKKHMNEHMVKGHLDESHPPPRTESTKGLRDRLGRFWLSRLFPSYPKDGIHEIDDTENTFQQCDETLRASDDLPQSI